MKIMLGQLDCQVVRLQALLFILFLSNAIVLKIKYTLCSQWWTQSVQKVQKSQKENLRETWNSKWEEHCVKPQIWDQSKRVWANKVFNWSKWLSMSSKVRLFHSFQTSHIKQVGTMFQISESCLPNPFLVALMFLIISWTSTHEHTHTHTHPKKHIIHKPFFFGVKDCVSLVVLFQKKKEKEKTYKHSIGHCQWILLFLMWMLFLIQKPIGPTELYRAVRDSQLIGLSGYSKEVLILNQKIILFTAFTFFIL